MVSSRFLASELGRGDDPHHLHVEHDRRLHNWRLAVVHGLSYSTAINAPEGHNKGLGEVLVSALTICEWKQRSVVPPCCHCLRRALRRSRDFSAWNRELRCLAFDAVAQLLQQLFGEAHLATLSKRLCQFGSRRGGRQSNFGRPKLVECDACSILEQEALELMPVEIIVATVSVVHTSLQK